jgi:hypothetical protein
MMDGSAAPPNNGKTRYLRQDGHGRLGIRMRQALRLSRLRTEVTSRDLVEWLYPRLKPEQWRGWHWYSSKRAADRFWERAGRAGCYSACNFDPLSRGIGVQN